MENKATVCHKYLLVILALFAEAPNCFCEKTDPGSLQARYVIGNLSSMNVVLNYTEYLPIVDSIERGAQFVKKECKDQFYWERWNCPDGDLTQESMTSKENRETAYVQALNAAGIMFDLVKKCQKGKIPGCKCERPQPVYPERDQPWLSGLCNDQMQYEEAVSTYLTDSVMKSNDARAAMYLHNSRAGRLNLKKTATTDCKCIGNTGACTTKICWTTVSSFRKIGSLLKQKYRRAVHVSYVDGELRIASGKRKGKKIYGEHLVYLESSSDYCKGDTTSGLMGMENRSCSQKTVKRKNRQKLQGENTGNTEKLPGEKNSCKRLCEDCGLKVRRRRIAVAAKCCKFHWCCYVTCKDCVNYRVESYCSKL